MAEILKKSKELVEAISFDVNGTMIGGKWMGGNGGLVSIETLKKCDQLRKTISAVEQDG